MEALIGLLLTLALVILGGGAGWLTERRHLASLAARESRLERLVITNARRDPSSRPVAASCFVSGHVVVASDYFKSLCASLRRIVGGPIRSYEKLLERGRREALLRLAEQAAAAGADLVLNVRFETMTIVRSAGRGGVTGVEVFAYGTAVRTAR